MIRFLLGLAILILLYRTIARDWITGTVLIGVLSLVLMNSTTITTEFQRIARGQ